MISIEIEENMS